MLYLQNKMESEINKVKEKYLPKIKEIEVRLNKLRPKQPPPPAQENKPTPRATIDPPVAPKRLEQNLQ